MVCIVGSVVVLFLVGYIAYDHHKHVVAELKAEIWYEKEIAPKNTDTDKLETVQIGTITQTVEDIAENQIFTLKEISNNFTRNIGRECPPSMYYQTIAQGTSVVYMDNHKYLFFSGDHNDKGYVLATFNDNETSIVKVEYSSTKDKPVNLQ